MRQRLALVGEQQIDVARFRLLPQQREAHAGALDRRGILSALQRVPGTAPGEAPFLRSRTLSRDTEIATPVRRAISALRRGKVHTVRPGSARIASAQANAAVPRTGGRPERGRDRSAATRPVANQLRQRRTLSARVRKVAPIAALVWPSSDSSSARARSASPRSDDRDSASSADRSSAVAVRQKGPLMSHHHPSNSGKVIMWLNLRKPA
jgi:hypothetical protein